MKTNDIKKGDRIKMRNGFLGTMMDNKKGNIRMAQIEGIFTEVGSVYAHDIVEMCPAGKICAWVPIDVTDAQKNVARTIFQLLG
jgi:hypothetical protein